MYLVGFGCRFWIQPYLRWLAQLSDLKNTNKDFNSVSFPGIDLKFGVVVAETDPQQIFWVLTKCARYLF